MIAAQCRRIAGWIMFKDGAFQKPAINAVANR